MRLSCLLFCFFSLSLTGCDFFEVTHTTSANASVSSPFNSVTETFLPRIDAEETPLATVELLPATLVVATATDVPSATPALVATPTDDTRLLSRYWREWPIIPDFSPKAKQILSQARRNQLLDLTGFSKVGDCQMVSGIFLGGYARGQYPIPSGREATVTWFAESMMRDSVTSSVGLGVNSVLNPMFGYAAGHQECEPKESPIACELRLSRPVVVMIAMGTNWKPNAEVSFEKHLRILVEQILEFGSLPILSTKADNVEMDWKLNLAIAKVAYDYDIPLVNVWRAVQDLPDRGLMPPPKDTYLSPDGWMRRNRVWLETLNHLHLLLTEEK